jgi:hypothetical protein
LPWTRNRGNLREIGSFRAGFRIQPLFAAGTRYLRNSRKKK